MPSWGNACETIPSPYRHFERKREIFFRSRSSRRCEDSGISAPKPSPQGEGAPKGRIGQERYERERRRPSQVRRLREHPIHRYAVPLPRWGRQRGGSFAAKKKANPASLRSAAPSKGRGSRGHSLYRHFERKREIFLVQRYASHMSFRGNDARGLCFSVFKHTALSGLQGRFLGCARNDDTPGTQFHILASPFSGESVEPDRILSQTWGGRRNENTALHP